MAYLTGTRLDACKKNQLINGESTTCNAQESTHVGSTQKNTKFEEGLKISLINQHATSSSLINEHANITPNFNNPPGCTQDPGHSWINMQTLLINSNVPMDMTNITITHESTCKHYSQFTSPSRCKQYPIHSCASITIKFISPLDCVQDPGHSW